MVHLPIFEIDTSNPQAVSERFKLKGKNPSKVIFHKVYSGIYFNCALLKLNILYSAGEQVNVVAKEIFLP